MSIYWKIAIVIIDIMAIIIIINRRRHRHKRKAKGLVITEIVFSNNTKIKGIIMALKLSTNDPVTGVVSGVDASGNVITGSGKVFAGLTVSSSDTSLFTAVLDPSNDQQIIVQRVAGTAGGSGTVNFTAFNSAGALISGADSIDVDADVPPTPVAQSLSVQWPS